MTPSATVHGGDRCVVVGVDGSLASLNAVRWAAAEAVAEDAVLRLVHVTAQAPDPPDADPVLIRAERAAVDSAGSVRVELASVIGVPGAILVGESERAAMVCIGSRHREHHSGAPPIGPIALTLAEGAHCPVAIIRTRRDGTPQTDGVISVVLSDEAGNDDVVHLAMHEGRLRHATVRQIDRRALSWIRRYPDVHVETVAAGTGGHYDRGDEADGGVGLAVVGPGDARRLATMAAPNCHPILGYPDCSLLLVRT
ncbi:universal stress protein [Mycolicibacterium obuense]|uniref:Universal stress protein UspA n=1 Tax=Mycolicibacterium obuense TaxID=1807 RepID=A0A0M2JXI2_9MYCO|nr:universal stress protein [Mycolicibacterium obuense]KKF01801.1 universal stress protein UspA [Mycolicibacterium obuense]